MVTITEDISMGKEKVKVPVVNELDGSRPTEFGYTPVCISGPNVSVPFNSPFYPGCGCQQAVCTKDKCSCIQSYGPSYNEEGCLQIFNQPTEFSQPVFECNSHCPCSRSCQNRVVQNGQHLQLQVFKTYCKGWGLRTLENIKECTFVCEYAGELISIKEAKKRAQELTDETGNYLIVLREHSSNDDQILRTHVDARFHGGASRFINHSCNPNLIMVPVRVDSIVPHLALFAARNIDSGEELSFDYSGEFDYWHSHETNDEHHELKALQDQRKDRKSCQCGAVNCREYLPFDSSLYSSESHRAISPVNG